MAHSDKIGGSSAARTIACPGSMQLVARIPNQSSSYAEEGTAMHLAMEDAWVDGTFEVDRAVESMIRQGYAPTENNRAERLNAACTAMNLYLHEHDVYPDDVDLEVPVEFTGELEGCFGTCDVLALGDGCVHVMDFKFGMGVAVEAHNNQQLLFYAAAATEDPRTAELFEGIDTVHLCIVQPTREGDCEVDTWTVPVDVLSQFRIALLEAYHVAQRPDAPVTEGKHCRFCRAQSICPTKNLMVANALQLDARDLNQLNDAMGIVDEVEAWCRDVRARAHEALERGENVQGYKLVQKRPVTKWVDEEGVWTYLRKNSLVNACTDKKLLTPTQMKKVLKEKGIDEGKIAPYHAKVSSGHTVAKEGDKREAVVVNTGLPTDMKAPVL